MWSIRMWSFIYLRIRKRLHRRLVPFLSPFSETEKGRALQSKHSSNVKCSKKPYSTRERHAESSCLSLSIVIAIWLKSILFSSIQDWKVLNKIGALLTRQLNKAIFLKRSSIIWTLLRSESSRYLTCFIALWRAFEIICASL